MEFIKKNKIVVILFVFLLIVIIGFLIFNNNIKNSKKLANKEQKEQIKDTNENQPKSTLSEGFQKRHQRHKFYEPIKCSILNDGDIIGYVNGDYIVTKNMVYALNKLKLFSNETNCKSISTEKFNSEIFSISIDGPNNYNIETKNGNYSYDVNDDKLTKLEDVETSYKKIERLGNNIIRNIGTSVNLGDYSIILSVDNKIKLYKPTYNNGEEVGEYKDINYDFKGETVKAIIDNFIKTDKAYYKISRYATNKDECKKYADIKCQYDYKIEKAKYLTENYDKIVIVSRNEIIDKYGNIYDN